METSTSTCTNVLFLCGTKAANVEGILKIFRASEKDGYGSGVYLTDNVNLAYEYGKCFAQEQDVVKKFTYLFVNKIKNVGIQRSPYKSNESFKII